MRKIRKGEMQNCLVCVTPFYVSQGMIGKTRFCSRKCADLAHRKRFCPKGHDKDIVGRRTRGCKKCANERELIKQKRDRINIYTIINRLKNKPCMDCGDWFDPWIMEFDHRPGEVKLFIVSCSPQSRPLKSLLKEIKKCDLVCSNCHQDRTYRRGQFGSGNKK